MIAIAIAAVAQAAVFAPPLGVPIRVINERREGEWRFRMERLVRFSAEGAGYRAEVWMVSARAEGPDKVGAMMEAGFGGLAGRMLVFHLDPAGKVTAIEDLDAIWKRFCDGMLVLVRTRSNTPESLVAPLRTLPAERRMAVLGSLVTALIDGEAAEPDGTRPIRLPGSSPYGGQLMLAGTRNNQRLGITRRSTVRAGADLPARDGATGSVELEQVRETNPATGMIAMTSERLRTRIGATGSERLSTMRVTAEPATPWPAAAR